MNATLRAWELSPPTASEIPEFLMVTLYRWPTQEEWALVGAFYLWMYLCNFLVPAYKRFGLPLSIDKSKRIEYRFNGLRTFILTAATYFAAGHYFNWIPLDYVYNRIAGMAIASLILVFLLSVYLFVSAHWLGRTDKISGSFVLDFWAGVELNPRLFGMDLKMFAVKCGMLLWGMTCLIIAEHQYNLYHHVTPRMILFISFQLWYILDYFYVEHKMLSTWDITDENWGFYLVFGDLFWIPFFFPVGTFYLIHDVTPLTVVETVFCLVVFISGYVIFRQSNSQKDAVKRHGENVIIWGKKPEMLNGKLLVSGWWGLLRKPNYFGDLLVALGFGLPAGTISLVPYAYFAYLFILLIHRHRRDDAVCAEKYGELWDEYIERVPYIMIPFIY